jgi:hypothetical protein
MIKCGIRLAGDQLPAEIERDGVGGGGQRRQDRLALAALDLGGGTARLGDFGDGQLRVQALGVSGEELGLGPCPKPADRDQAHCVPIGPSTVPASVRAASGPRTHLSPDHLSLERPAGGQGA